MDKGYINYEQPEIKLLKVNDVYLPIDIIKKDIKSLFNDNNIDIQYSFEFRPKEYKQYEEDKLVLICNCILDKIERDKIRLLLDSNGYDNVIIWSLRGKMKKKSIEQTPIYMLENNIKFYSNKE